MRLAARVACVLIALAACGGSSKPAPAAAPPLTNKPAPPPLANKPAAPPPRTSDGTTGADGGVASGAAAPRAAIDPNNPDTGVPECDQYLRLFMRYMSCDKVPQQAKDAGMAGLHEMLGGWAVLEDPAEPAEAKQAAAEACKQGVDAIEQSAKAIACPL